MDLDKGSITIDDYFSNKKPVISIGSEKGLSALKRDQVIRIWVDKNGGVLVAQKIVGTRNCDMTGIKRRFKRAFGCNCGKNCKCKRCIIRQGTGAKARGHGGR